jgi:hypothetical protein
MLLSIVTAFKNLINRPGQVFAIAVGLAVASVVLDGTSLRLWSLHREHAAILTRIDEAKVRTDKMAFKIVEAQSSQFIERAARDQFDFVKEGDLVFVFSGDSDTEVAENTTGL